MWKSFVTSLVCWSCFSSLEAQLPSHFPFYDEVVDHVIEKAVFHTCFTDRRTKLNILKDTDGFWLTVDTYQEEGGWRRNNKELIWSEDEGFEEEIVVEGDCFENKVDYSHFRKPPTPKKYRLVEEYNINRFFGDEHWANYTINYYKKYPLISYEDYYSLGRAHSNRSTHYIPKYGKQHILEQEPQFIEEIIEHGEKAMQCYKKVQELQPTYTTIVGGIYTKYSNEMMTLNMHLAMLGLKEKAVALVKGKVLYTSTTLAFAKNSLLSCPTNAILITYGDNDTYPLLYLQQAHNVRPDVLIANASLLSTPYYINHLTNPNYYKDNYLQTALKAVAYQGKTNEYLLLDRHTEEEAWPVKELIEFLETEEKSPKTAPTFNFILKPPKEKPITLSCSKNYIIRSSILLLTILDKNYTTRPIVFGPSYGFSNNNIAEEIGAKKHLHIQGINHQFEQETIEPLTLNKKDALKNYHIFSKQLKWPVMEQIEEEDKPSFHSYTLIQRLLLQSLIKEGEVEKAKEINTTWYQSFSKTISQISFPEQLYFAEIAYELEQLEQANHLLESFLNHLLEYDFEAHKLTFIQETILPQLKKLMKQVKSPSLKKQYQQVKKLYQQ